MDMKRLVHTIRYCTFLNSASRGNYIRKKRIFGSVGKNVFLPFMVLLLRCENIFLHNNIEIASGARLVPHDAIHGIFNRMNTDGLDITEHIGKIEIFDNVFVGANAIILGPCKIGPNAIVAAGTVVNKDIPPNSVWAGVPGKEIGKFDELMMKRINNRFKNTGG